ncbi:NAP1-related protein 2 [Camellia lanceoleosa]|nr:NAP1-related protein 2 [Camellia lanceoleosa]
MKLNYCIGIQRVNEEAAEKVLAIERSITRLLLHYCSVQFLSHPALGDLLSEEDSKIFKYLDSLDVEDFKDLKLGYSITFNELQHVKGAANGVNHEKKGNKRPPSDERFAFID